MKSRVTDGAPSGSRPRLPAELPAALELLDLRLDHVFDLPVDETIRDCDHEALPRREGEIMENIRFTTSGSENKRRVGNVFVSSRTCRERSSERKDWNSWKLIPDVVGGNMVMA